MREIGFFLADTYLSWIPAVPMWGLIAIVLSCLGAWTLLRVFWGASQVRGRIGLAVLRAGSLGILAAILFGPTIVNEESGEVTRPSLLYLFDGSQSMKLGQEKSRWQNGLQFVSDAETAAGKAHTTQTQSVRFGHRLKPLKDPAAKNDRENQANIPNQFRVTNTSSGSSAGGDALEMIDPPEASDTRLGDALRQLLPQVSAKSSAGVVLLSDGRVRASESVERLAEYFGESGVPLHVVPIGQASGTGDIAVVSLVVPNRVRKFTENNLQVFLRSFGFTGQRTTVRIRSRNKIGSTASSELAMVPITLSGGAQSVQLTFRVDEDPEDLEIIVDPIEGELTKRNNTVDTRVEIDRTKVRVLYIESNAVAGQQSIFSEVFSGLSSSRERVGTGTVQDALQADDDVECTVLISAGNSSPRALSRTSSRSNGGFPKTRAELFAYDCVVFSNVGPDVLEEEQVQWLAQWVEGRGGGLVVCGAEALAPNAWKSSPLEPLLPLSLREVQRSGRVQAQISASEPQHAVWRLRLESQTNVSLLNQVPSLWIGGTGYQPKSTAQILAKRTDDESAVMVVHRAGRGRVLASTASLGGEAFSNMANSWGAQPERVAAKFWRNMVYWATEGSSTGRRRLVAESDKRFYRPGEPLKIKATAYDEGARRTQRYRVWAMFEPVSLDDMSLYSPILWPDNIVRESGEVGPRIAWGEELQLKKDPNSDLFAMDLMLSEASGVGDSGFRVEMTAYEGAESNSAFDHGTQVDSTSLAVQVLSDPFEQQNPLPNHELLQRVASVSGGSVLETPGELAELLRNRPQTFGPPKREESPAWSQWWLWASLLGLLSTEWIWRRMTGLA